jgi:hypothetical protein
MPQRAALFTKGTEARSRLHISARNSSMILTRLISRRQVLSPAGRCWGSLVATDRADGSDSAAAERPAGGRELFIVKGLFAALRQHVANRGALRALAAQVSRQSSNRTGSVSLSHSRPNASVRS